MGNRGNPFSQGTLYRRRRLHNDFGGQERGGISTPRRFPLVFLFSGDTGHPFGYHDTFGKNGDFWYTGEGQVGDMELTRGNGAIRFHERDGRSLHLFLAVGGGWVIYVGEVVYLAHKLVRRVDRQRTKRNAYVFHLRLRDRPT